MLFTLSQASIQVTVSHVRYYFWYACDGQITVAMLGTYWKIVRPIVLSKRIWDFGGNQPYIFV